MATFRGEVRNDQIVLVTWLSAPGEGVDHSNPHAFNALVDTGAQVCAISQRVVDQVGFVQIGHMPITPVTGEPIDVAKYRIRIDLPIAAQASLPSGELVPHHVLTGKELEVGLLPYQPVDHDVLLGMDFLFGYHITIYQEQYILSN